MRFLFLGALAAAAPVCNVPVFRYALERWRVTPYPGVLFHQGPLGADSRKLLAELEQSGLNVAVEAVDVAGPMSEDVRGLWEAERQHPLPRLLLSYPERPDAIAWSGAFDRGAVLCLVDSPARRDIVQKLISGTSVVWVFFESGDAAKDKAALDLIEGELARLEKEIKIPAPGPDDPPLRSAIPLKVAFAVQRVPPGKSEEAVFIESVARARKAWSLPAVVPVFGRGRALGSLCGDEIDPGPLIRMAEYVTDACSCEVKELNPGVDLLFTADWEALLEAGPAPPEVKAPPVTLQLPKAPAPAAPIPPTSSAPPRHLLWVGLATATALAVLAGRLALRKSP